MSSSNSETQSKEISNNLSENSNIPERHVDSPIPFTWNNTQFSSPFLWEALNAWYNSSQQLSIIPPDFIDIINKIITNQTFHSLRSSRSLHVDKEDINKFVINREDGFCIVCAPGGGMCQWYLCCYNKKLYFIFQNNLSPMNKLTARETSPYDIAGLIKQAYYNSCEFKPDENPHELFANDYPELVDFLPKPGEHYDEFSSDKL